MKSEPQPIARKVLIVDDEPQNLKLVGEILRRANISFILALNGREALEAVLTEQPDLILLDVMMPELDGFDVCAKLKSLPETASIPVIFLSAASSPAEIVSGFTAGAVDYIKKPFVREELLARVFTHLNLSATQKKIKAEAEAKAELLARLAHDIKNPSGAIKGLTQYIAEELKSSQYENLEEMLSMTELIRDSAEGMSDLVIGILNEAQADADASQRVVTEAIQVIDVIDYLLQLNYLQAKEKDVHLKFNKAFTPELAISRRILVEMFDNLINNAIKYSKPESTVQIRLIHSLILPHGMRFEVIDQAQTIAPERRATLFEAFVRADTSELSTSQSHGVGLSIVRRLVTMNNGKVGVEPRANDAGNRFYIELPL
ncbi:hybrid sensor histidine kinase/response regulator [Coraliomargarita sp. SDUM461004]|uniref:histidine kinase n=1 Tax=Thalassobacterium sedimentorum TaxID=3041258 RepID=A0ABU1AJP3_9BACT|nr:hybrid sensor histidine kinase/response regulator [Coraliomargarita sp. SDUM461004]MDQ8195035.1 hybrid sensor histidine kinase/response regulator [Coraliomargarita sp. SDUM461004]